MGEVVHSVKWITEVILVYSEMLEGVFGDLTDWT